MKRIICMCLFAVLALPTWSPAAAIGPARVSYVEGDILFRAPDSDEWLPATVNTPLDEGDAIWCADDGRVVTGRIRYRVCDDPRRPGGYRQAPAGDGPHAALGVGD